jgi:ABC-type Fe3+/spermidine/putrescine transport system ATPase subunit
VYVTHDQQEAMSLGDQVVVLDQGRIMQKGSPFEVYSRPANDFVANFIGNANLYDVEVASPSNGVRRIRARFGELSIPEGQFQQLWPGLAPGPVRLLCRPQDIRIAEAGGANCELCVDERLFLGDRLRISGKTRGGERMQLEVHNTVQVNDGDVLPVTISFEHVHFIQAKC